MLYRHFGNTRHEEEACFHVFYCLQACQAPRRAGSSLSWTPTGHSLSKSVFPLVGLCVRCGLRYSPIILKPQIYYYWLPVAFFHFWEEGAGIGHSLALLLTGLHDSGLSLIHNMLRFVNTPSLLFHCDLVRNVPCHLPLAWHHLPGTAQNLWIHTFSHARYPSFSLPDVYCF